MSEQIPAGRDLDLGHNPFDTALEDARREAEAKRKLRREREDKDFVSLMNTRAGRDFAWGWLSDAGVFQSSFRGDGHTEFREGMRAMGLKLLDRINRLCPERYVTMLTEQQEDETHG